MGRHHPGLCETISGHGVAQGDRAFGQAQARPAAAPVLPVAGRWTPLGYPVGDLGEEGS